MAKAFSKTKKVLAVLIALALTLASGCAPKGYTERIHTTFSSTMTYSAKVLGGNVKSALDEIDEMLDAVDKSVNIHRSDSLLTAFNNAKANQRVEVDKHAYEMALVAKEAFLITDGAFNVSLGALSEAWGVDAEGVKKYVYGNEKKQSLPSAESCANLLAQADLSALTVAEDEGKYYLTKTNDALTLDFGGLAKGYCADKCKEIALKHGVTSALFQISGNIMLIGEYIEKGNARDWGVGVINPRQTPNTSGYVCGFYRSGNLSVVTSGDYERCYFYDYGDTSVRVNHIIDGRTGYPTGVKYDQSTKRYVCLATAVCSATIVGESSLWCDILSTTACVVGLERASEIISQKGYDALLFTADKKMKVVGEFTFAQSEKLYLTEYEQV